MLYRLQKFNMCSTLSEDMRQQKIIQLEADKADYDCDFEDNIVQKQSEIDGLIR